MVKSEGDRKREVEGERCRLDDKEYGQLAGMIVASGVVAALMRMVLRVVSRIVNVIMCIDLLLV